jgi:hypothetical protein
LQQNWLLRNVLAALRLMKTTVLGIEKFEVLLDNKSLVIHKYLFFKSKFLSYP